jgi:DNA polymerase-3 subunit gamma/tau
MAYQSLYRRYRPRRFSEVRDQEQVVRALRNAVRDDRVGHAYLFSGPRGTGKTSTARILAKALNCEFLDGGEPCGTCESCLAIDHGTSYDVQELDAASNRGVDDVRDLIGRVALGSPGRTKVYILDEVHMLTKEASAALLKTLEEPPEHVVFVLATTDPHKVLPTIRSRTQHYEFHLLGAEDLAEHVQWVIHDAGLDLSDDAVDHVIRAGGGSARDTLSALERVAASGGVIDEGSELGDLLDAVATADTGRALVAVSEAMAAGRDPRVLGEELLAQLRDVFLLRMGVTPAHLPPAEVAKVQVWADQLGDRATTRALEALGEALLEMRQAPDPRIPLEVALVKLTRTDGDTSLDGLVARIAKLEAALAAGIPAAPAPAAPASAPPAPAASAPAAAATPTPAPPSRPPSAPSAASAPAAASARGEGPAALARAKLAEQRAASSNRPGARPAPAPAPAPPAPAASAPAPAPAPAPPADPPPAAAPAPAPAPSAVAPDAEVVAATATRDVAAPTAAPAPAPTGDLDALWSDRVLPALSGLTKAMYQSARLVGLDGGTATVGVDNDHHRDNCERKRPDVERALSEVVGRPLTVRFEVGGLPATSGDAARPGAAPAPVSDDPEEHLAGADVHDLDDAPDAPTGGLSALTEAFPGAEIIEEA